MDSKTNKTAGVTKRKKLNPPDQESDNPLPNWPRFLVIDGTDPDKPITKLSPFAISKGLKGLAGTLDNVKRLRNGQILVEATRRGQSDNLLQSKRLCDLPISVTPHRALNYKKGIMRCPDLRDCPTEEILENLKSQCVTDVKRIMATRDGIRSGTNTLILTFNLSQLPQSIKIGYLTVPLEVFVPNPLRCFKCQRFGHHKDRCQRSPACAKCGKTEHDETQCDKPLHCINCDGNHAAFSKNCSKWLQEKEIQHLKHTMNISFPEARQRVQIKEKSFASVVQSTQKTKKSISIQTDYTWPTSSHNPIRIPETTSTPHKQTIGTQTSNIKPTTTNIKSTPIKQPTTTSKPPTTTTKPPTTTTKSPTTTTKPPTTTTTHTKQPTSTTTTSKQPTTITKPTTKLPTTTKQLEANIKSIKFNNKPNKSRSRSRSRDCTTTHPQDPIATSNRYQGLQTEDENEGESMDTESVSIQSTEYTPKKLLPR